MSRLRPLLLPLGIAALALTFYNLRISREMGDFEAYRQAGLRVIHRAPLYTQTEGWSATERGDVTPPFRELPAFALALAAVAALGKDAARVSWFALSCALIVILLRWSVRALPERRWSERSLLMVALVLLSWFFALELALGQSHLVLAGLLLAMLGAWQVDAPRLAGGLLAAAAFVSPVALILTPWLIASAGVPAGLVTVTGLAAGLMAPALVYGWTGNLDLLATWWFVGGRPAWQDLIAADGVSLTAMWARLIGATSPAVVLGGASMLVLLAVAATMWRQRVRIATPDYLEVAFLMLLIPLFSPRGGPAWFVLATPAVVVVTDRWREFNLGWRWASGAALASLGLSFLAVPGSLSGVQSAAWPVVPIAAVVVASTMAQIRLRGLA